MIEHKAINEKWNKLHCELVMENKNSDRSSEERAKHRNDAMLKYCEEMITKAKKAYHDGTPIMSDKSFDWIKNNLKNLNALSKILNQDGSRHEEKETFVPATQQEMF